MPTPIVTVQVTQQVAPTPNELQKTGALITQGGTTLTPGMPALLQQYSDLAPLLAAPLTLSSMTWGAAYGGQVTGSTVNPHGVTVGSFFPAVISGVSPGGYNGTFMAESTGASSFSYYLPTNPGPVVTQGKMLPPPAAELDSMARTFFSQGVAQSVYVLELGAGTPDAGVNTLQAFIASTDSQFFYSYLVPRNWDANPTFLAFLANFESPTSKTYFFVTTTLSTYSSYTLAMKDVIALVEAPAYSGWVGQAVQTLGWATGKATATFTNPTGIKPGDWFQLVGQQPSAYAGWHQAMLGTTGSTVVYPIINDPGIATATGNLVARAGASAGIPASEFTAASAFYVSLNYDPSPTNKVPPYAFSFLFGVTQFPTFGNSALIQQLKNANINYVGSGAEGGISDLILLWGHTMDGRPFNYWYSVDWMQINVDEAISNAIINGSNTTINPLYYNQDGINRLEDVAANVGASAVSFGLAVGRIIQVGLDPTIFNDNMNRGLYLGNVVINAVPFATYVRANPGDYKIGKYAGLTMVYTPQRGFESIIFNIVVTDFVATAI